MQQEAYRIERADNEGDKPFHAKVIYLQLGSSRSISRVAALLQKDSGKTGSKKTFERHLSGWSSKFEWCKSARDYDAALAELAGEEHRKQYLADIESHRLRYKGMGESLYQAAALYLEKLRARLDTLQASELSPERLMTDLKLVATVGTMAADLEAHSLQVEKLAQMLERSEI